MTNFILRSEELQDSKILDYYVGTVHDEERLGILKLQFPAFWKVVEG